jgi:predicted kinase
MHLAPRKIRDQIISDREGDALDAVFAAVAAQRARNAAFVIENEHYAEAMLEGWIF